jgi:ketosteroid isomerase-like protein
MRFWIVVAAFLAAGAAPASAPPAATPGTPAPAPSTPAAVPGTPATAAPAPKNVRAEVQEFVRGYVKATNEADAPALSGLYARVPEVTSVTQGQITRGWESIRAAADSLFGSSSGLQVELGWIDVTPLPPQHALAVAPATVTVNTMAGRLQFLGALSMVLRKTPEGWKILHDHASVQTLVPGLGN